MIASDFASTFSLLQFRAPKTRLSSLPLLLKVFFRNPGSFSNNFFLKFHLLAKVARFAQKNQKEQVNIWPRRRLRPRTTMNQSRFPFFCDRILRQKKVGAPLLFRRKKGRNPSRFCPLPDCGNHLASAEGGEKEKRRGGGRGNEI